MQKSIIVVSVMLVFTCVFSVSAMHHEGAAQSQPEAATQPATQPDTPEANAHVQQMGAITHAVAVMVSTEGNTAHGTVSFVQTDDGVHITADIAGLSANASHAIHIHEFGDLTAADGTSAGGHYNPEGHDHGLPEQDARHAGDLGNLMTDDDGNAQLDLTVDNITVAGMHNPIIGRGVIIHAKTDDGGQPTGNAGARISMGVIGIAKNP